MLDQQSYSTECSEPGFMKMTCSRIKHLQKEEKHEWQSNLRDDSPYLTIRSSSQGKHKTHSMTPTNKQIRFAAAGLFHSGKTTTLSQQEQKCYDLPDEVDLFTDKQVKRMGLPNLLDSERYDERRSFRFNLQKCENRKNNEFLESFARNLETTEEQTLKVKDKSDALKHKLPPLCPRKAKGI